MANYPLHIPFSPKIFWSLILILGVQIIFVRYLTFSHAILGTNSDLTPAELISLTNLARLEAGVPALNPNPLLMQAASQKAADMLRFGYFDHTSITDHPPWYFLDQNGYRYALAGENLARDYTDAQAVISAWLKSPTHQANLLNPNYSETGLSVIEGKYPNGRTTHIIVQFFGLALADPASQNAALFQESIMLSGYPVLFVPQLILLVLFICLIIGLLGNYFHWWGNSSAHNYLRHRHRHLISNDLWSH
jgi:hypothetical protein